MPPHPTFFADEEVLLHLEIILYASKTQKFEIVSKNWPINMYNDLGRLKTAKIEGGDIYVWNCQLFMVPGIGLNGFLFNVAFPITNKFIPRTNFCFHVI